MDVYLFQKRYNDIKKNCKLIFRFDDFEIYECSGHGYIVDIKNNSYSKIDGEISSAGEKLTAL